MSGVIIARHENSHKEGTQFECRWHTNDVISSVSGATVWQSVDLFFRQTSGQFIFSADTKLEEIFLSIQVHTEEQQPMDLGDLVNEASFRFLADCLAAASENEHGSVARLIVPRSRGFIVRSDIISLRLLDCPGVRSVASLSKPLQFFEGDFVPWTRVEQLPKVFAVSVGSILLEKPGKSCDTPDLQLTFLDVELGNRLSFPWLSAHESKRHTLALVEGGRSSPDRGGNGETVFKAAEALGIDMVVLDNAGHWLDGPRWAHWRKEFLPIKCTLQSDQVFTDRVVDAIRSYNGRIDGLVTFCDHYKEPVAAAALQLLLPTYDPSAFALATDKFRLRLFEGHEAYRASSAEEASSIVRAHNLEFPLIMKPCTGFLSEGVFRLESLEQLKAGVQVIDLDRHGKDFTLERYCDGPEVDANFVLCDGEVLFFEASDEFPKGADINGDGKVNSFVELANVLPSNLPDDELKLLQNSLHRSLLTIGFQDGIYHLEARVANSSMEYQIMDSLLDLNIRAVPPKEAPSAWLIEINPRPPGIQASDAIKHTYGIDYWGLGLLFALEDRLRVKHLSHSFAQGAQYWCEMVFIPVEKGGVYDSGDACAELFQNQPWLAGHVSWCQCFFSRGDRVMDPSQGINSWIAHFNVFSRTSRAHVLEIAECIRREIRFSIL